LVAAFMSGFVEHGRTIWEVALVLLVALGAGSAMWGPVLRRRLLAWRARRGLGRARSARGLADGMVVTLAGTLRARGPHFALTGEAARTVVAAGDVTHLRTDDVQLEVEGQVVDLVGDIEVALGSGDSAARVSEERGTSRVRTRVVRPGDAVLVRGALQACAGDVDAVGYRTAARRFRMVGEGEGVPLRIVADEAVGGASRRGLAILRGAAFGALAFGALFVGGGEAARWLAAGAGASDVALRPGWGLSATAFSAATPFHRAAVFETIVTSLRERPDERLAGATAGMTTNGTADCAAGTVALSRAGDLRRAALHGERCRSQAARLEAARAYLALAEYDAADRILRPLMATLDPADRERALLAQVLGSRPSPWTVRDEDRCVLVSAAAATGGLGSDFARKQLRLALRDDGPTRRVCALLLAPHLSGADRDEVLAGTVDADDPLAALLEAAEDPAQVTAIGRVNASTLVRADADLLVFRSAPHEGLVPGLARSLLARDLPPDASPDAWARRAWIAADAATAASLAGDDDEARLWVAKASTAARRSGLETLVVAVRVLAAAIELAAGSPDGATVLLKGVPHTDRTGRWVQALATAMVGRDAGALAQLTELAGDAWRGPLQDAAAGRGRRLWRQLAEDALPASSSTALLVPFVARVRHDQARLRGWARWDGARQARARASEPVSHLALVAGQLELARALGDEAHEGELEATIGRLRAALFRDEIALAAALVGEPRRASP
jgi:hypothetical protein